MTVLLEMQSFPMTLCLERLSPWLEELSVSHDRINDEALSHNFMVDKFCLNTDFGRYYLNPYLLRQMKGNSIINQSSAEL